MTCWPPTIKENPTRFAGLAAVPLQNPAAAIRELERAVTVLGLSGVLVNGHVLDTYLDEPRYRDFWEALAGHDVPLYLHPNSWPLGWSVFEGRPELLGPNYACPRPARLRAVTVPWHASTHVFTIARPRPVPPVEAVREMSGRKNGSKIRDSASSGTPGPSSATVSTTSSPREEASIPIGPSAAA